MMKLRGLKPKYLDRGVVKPNTVEKEEPSFRIYPRPIDPRRKLMKKIYM